MSTQIAIRCEDDQAEAVSRLAYRYGITEEEVVKQLIDLGLDALDEEPV